MLSPGMEKDVELMFHDTGSNGRLDINRYLVDKVEEIEKCYPCGKRRIGVVVCGPAKFTDVCRRTCVELQDKIHGDTVVSYITDPFDW
ncbi:unnamed protein product [Ambrosiozyma monospora]|uniref:Unnamed protein product n=1 Tax=Ambrosiozyma monospora TaxID=43982 RepID=A0A9W6YKK6_AMBMO|nr:unnamed protein product [Ambrosiozyma monospora]